MTAEWGGVLDGAKGQVSSKTSSLTATGHMIQTRWDNQQDLHRGAGGTLAS